MYKNNKNNKGNIVIDQGVKDDLNEFLLLWKGTYGKRVKKKKLLKKKLNKKIKLKKIKKNKKYFFFLD